MRLGAEVWIGYMITTSVHSLARDMARNLAHSLACKLARCLFALFLLCCSPALLQAAPETTSPSQCMRLGADESLGDAFAAFDAFFQDLYNRAGYCAKSVAMDPKRIEQLLIRGELDGDWFRPGDYVASMSDKLISLPQPLFGLEARLIWLDRTAFSGKPEDLRGLKVGYQAGFRWLESHLPQMGAHPFAVSSTAQTWELLARGRIDVFATSGLHEAAIIDHLRSKEDAVNRALWTTVSFFHALNPRHQDKAEKLNSALKVMILEQTPARSFLRPGMQPAALNE